MRIGDLVWYVIGRGPGTRAIWARGVILRRGRAGRVGVRTVLGPRVRYVKPTSLSTADPTGDVDVYVSEQDRPAYRAPGPPVITNARH